MADQCVALVRGRAIRVTELNNCAEIVMAGGAPVRAVSEGFVSVAFANEVDEAQEINQKNANGDICVLVPPKQTIKWVNVTIVFCKVDPWIFTKMTGWPLVLNEEGDAIGFRGQRQIPQDRGTALETWTGVKETAVCAGPFPKYGYLLLPYITSAMVSDFTVEDAAINFTIVGKGLPNPAWGVGPYDIEIDGTPAAVGPLDDPMSADDLYHFQVTELPPPGAVCGQYPAVFGFTLTPDAVTDFEVDLAWTAVTMNAATVDWGDGTVDDLVAPAVGPGPSHVYSGPAATYLVTVTDAVTGATTYEVVTTIDVP